MKVIERRLGCLVVRRWAGGVSLAFSFPKGSLRQRLADLTYPWLRRHPEVAHNEAQAARYSEAIDLLEAELDEAEAALHQAVVHATQARWDAQAIYDHAQEIVEIVHRYQGTLNTLAAPDPHESRVQMVVDNFFTQFKDRYDHG